MYSIGHEIVDISVNEKIEPIIYVIGSQYVYALDEHGCCMHQFMLKDEAYSGVVYDVNKGIISYIIFDDDEMIILSLTQRELSFLSCRQRLYIGI